MVQLSDWSYSYHISLQLQQDLRRILISLARASAFVIGTGPCAAKLIALFNQRLINRRRHQVRSIETLLEMGFSLDKIHQALGAAKYVMILSLVLNILKLFVFFHEGTSFLPS